MSERTLNRKEKKAATRRAIKRAARKCFSDAGAETVQISDISSAAGVAHGTFYVHFPSKADLLDELLADFNDEMVARLAPITVEFQTENLDELLQDVARVFLDHWLENRGFVQAYAQVLTGGTTLDALTGGINPQMQSFLSAGLQNVDGTGQHSSAEIQLAIQALLASWMRVGLQVLFAGVERDAGVRVLSWLTRGALLEMIGPDQSRS